ncbi:hypothetical protein KQX64_06850 [Rhodopseudomonas palustris]|nr:hypothetical protein KQX64_06850 [Rhodopseudomonas palustris]
MSATYEPRPSEPGRGPLIMTEWEWQPAPLIGRQTMRELLVWRQMVFGTVEAFSIGGPFYGNVGLGFPPLDFTTRTGPRRTPEDCRAAVEQHAIRALVEGLGLP